MYIINSTFSELVPPGRYCELEYIPVRPPLYATTVMKKWSPFKDHIDVGYLWILEIGILKYQDEFWAEEKPKCVHETNFAPVGVETLFPAFTILLFFGFFSLIIVNVEKLYFYINKKLSQNKK